jgi:hypothetical protein
MATPEEKLRLAAFLEQSRQALGEIIDRLDRVAPSPGVVRGQAPTPDQVALQRAWAAFQESGNLQRSISELRDGDQQSEQARDLDRLLTDHGLFGPQLDFKLHLFDRHLRRFREVLEEFDAPPAPTQSTWQRVWARLGQVRVRREPRQEEVS